MKITPIKTEKDYQAALHIPAELLIKKSKQRRRAA